MSNAYGCVKCTCFVLYGKCLFVPSGGIVTPVVSIRPRGRPRLFCPPRDDLERIVGKQPLQLERVPGPVDTLTTLAAVSVSDSGD